MSKHKGNVEWVWQTTFHFLQRTASRVNQRLENGKSKRQQGFGSWWLVSQALKNDLKGNCSIIMYNFHWHLHRDGSMTRNLEKGYSPVFKKDDRHDTSNYRPITVLPVVGEIYEKLLSKQITNFMDPILSDNLTAYRKSHSCETALIWLVDEWKMELDCGKLVGMLSTDMSKAFGSLYSPLLIKKLESYRFSDKALDLVRSYFHNRQNRVKLVSVLSQWRVLKRGCPQGSCFGPLLWNISQNDLNYYFTNRNISMYAQW